MLFRSIADCKLIRPNAQYFGFGRQIEWPNFGRRYVTPGVDQNGFVELGPCEDAYGIGDSLTLTPLIEALGGKVILKLPPTMEHIAPLFTDVCPVLFTEDYPVFKHYSHGGAWHMGEAKLRAFNITDKPYLPVMRITTEEKKDGQKYLDRFEFTKPLIAFCPTCSQIWAHVRQLSPEYWQPYIDQLSVKWQVIQFGYESYPLLSGAFRFKGLKLRNIAILYSLIRRYIGVDTGDVHMMLAVGGSVLVLNPPKQPGHNPKEWEYAGCLAARYVNPDDQDAVQAAVRRLC